GKVEKKAGVRRATDRMSTSRRRRSGCSSAGALDGCGGRTDIRSFIHRCDRAVFDLCRLRHLRPWSVFSVSSVLYHLEMTDEQIFSFLAQCLERRTKE